MQVITILKHVRLEKSCKHHPNTLNPIQGGAKTPALHIFIFASMEARSFMKFETYVHKIVLDHQPNFHKVPCKDARALGKTRALAMPYKDSDPSQQKSRKCVFRPCVNIHHFCQSGQNIMSLLKQNIQIPPTLSSD